MPRKKKTDPESPAPKKKTAKKSTAKASPAEPLLRERDDGELEAVEPDPSIAAAPQRRSPKLERLAAQVVPQQEILGRSRKQSYRALKMKVRIFYDIQSMRLHAERRLDPRPDGTEIALHEGDLFILKLRVEELHKAETNALRDVADHLGTIPFYREVLSDKKTYKGIGPTLAGVILSEFDIERSDTVSKMWSFAGLRPVDCLRCKHCMRVVTEDEGEGLFVHVRAAAKKPGTEDETPKKDKCKPKLTMDDLFESGKAMKPVRGQKNTYNSFLRAKLCGVAAPCLLKAGIGPSTTTTSTASRAPAGASTTSSATPRRCGT